MPRSKPRKAAKEKAALERRQLHTEHQARKAEDLELLELAREISRDSLLDTDASDRSPDLPPHLRSRR